MRKKILAHPKTPKILFYGLSLIVFGLIAWGLYYSTTHTKEIRTDSMDRAYEFAEKDYKQGRYIRALSRYNSFLNYAEELPHRDKRVVEATSRIGRIYLYVKRKPEVAINILSRFVNSPHFNELENEELREWIEVAKQAIEIQPPPKNLKTSARIFSQAKSHFDLALESEGKDKEVFHKNMEASERYLVALINKQEDFEHKAEAFYMLGIIDEKMTGRSRAAEHFYFKEAVRLAPHSDIAKKAFNHLYRAFHSENTKDGVDSTPREIEEFLIEFKHLAE